MADPHFKKRLETAKAGSVSHNLMKSGRLVDAIGSARFREATGADLRPAHTRLFPHIDLEGTRITELARRVGISKQAVSVLVEELVEMGALQRERDPDDGRAFRVRFSTEPGRNLLDGLAVLATLDSQLEAELGTRAVRELNRHLKRVLDLLADWAPEG